MAHMDSDFKKIHVHPQQPGSRTEEMLRTNFIRMSDKGENTLIQKDPPQQRNHPQQL